MLRSGTPSWISGCLRHARTTSTQGSWTRARPSTRCTCGSAGSACWCSWRSTSAPEEIFSHYAYFSSYSDSWVQHAGDYVEQAVTRLGLGADSFVVEVASNDGYLLQHVVSKGIRCLGIEPAANIAEVAVAQRESPPSSTSWAGRRARRSGAAHGRGGPGRRQQRLRPRARHRRLRARAPRPGRRRRLRHHRDPAPAAAHRGPRVRHDLPRALLVPVPADDAAGAGGRGPARRRRRGAVHPRRFIADLVGAEEAEVAPSEAVARVLADEAAAGLDTLEGHPASPPRWRRYATTCSSS